MLVAIASDRTLKKGKLFSVSTGHKLKKIFSILNGKILETG